ncbi:MAG: hypothetical protein PS018_20115 [bacterium]|nr:hypothetical protein [bacterium]
MASLVLQLQEAALAKDSKASDLLRMAFVVARKLDLPDFENWVDLEMNGYKKLKDVPEYRKVRGVLRAHHVRYGWQDMGFADSKTADSFCLRPISDPVSRIESLLENQADHNYLLLNLPTEITNDLQKNLPYGMTRPCLHLSEASFSAILDTVKNLILDRALKLEKAGVLGEGMTFSSEEQSKAKAAMGPSYSATNMTVVHSMQQSQIQQASPGANQTFTIKPIDVEVLKAFVKEVRALVDKVPATDQPQLKADLATLEAQAIAPTPSKNIVSEAASSVRKILESAAGSLTAANLPALLQKAAELLL